MSSDKATRDRGAAYYFKVMDVPPVIRNIIAKDGSKPFKRLEQGLWGSGSSIVSKGTDTHNISRHGAAVDTGVITRLPQLLADPLAVFSGESGTNPNSYRVLVPGATVAIEPKGLRGFVMTLFPLDISQVQNWAKLGLLHYVNDKAAQKAASIESLSADQSRKFSSIDWIVAQSEAKLKGRTPVTKSDIEGYPVAALSTPRGTLGDLTPDQQAAANEVYGAPKTVRQRLEEFSKDWKKSLIQGVFDQFAPIKELDPKAYWLTRLSKGGDGSLEALMLYGKLKSNPDGTLGVRYTKAGGMQGFASKLAALKGEHDRFLAWVSALRADRLKGIGLENLMSQKNIDALKTLNQGSMKDGSLRDPLYKQALKDLNDFNDNILQIAVDSGLIDDATRQMYKDTPYIPFYRLQDEGNVAGFNVKPGIVNQYAWKKLKGGTQKLNEDLLANLLQNWSHLITASAKNRAAKATLDAAARTGVAAQIPLATFGSTQGHQNRELSVIHEHKL